MKRRAVGNVCDFEDVVGKERDDCRLLAYYFAEFPQQ